MYVNLPAIADATKSFGNDRIGGADFPRVKIGFGIEGAITDVSADNPMPVAGPLTDTQLRATAVPVSGTFWQTTQPVSGPLTDAQLRAAAVPVTPPTNATTTREYGAGYRVALATGAAASFALAGNLTLGASREIRIRASSAFWLRFGTALTGQDASIPTPPAAAASIPFDANQAEVVRVPAGTTHISVIAESAAGFATFTPVA